MKTGRSILGGALVGSWAVLLAARYVAAGVYASAPGRSFASGLDAVGFMLPLLAWMCLVAGVLLANPLLVHQIGPVTRSSVQWMRRANRWLWLEPRPGEPVKNKPAPQH